MSTNALTCPECQATLQLSTQVEAGKKVRCPKCRALFAAPAELQAQEVEAVAEQQPFIEAERAHRPRREHQQLSVQAVHLRGRSATTDP